MNLRNKKTGETINGGFVVCEYKDGARFSVKDKPCFDSLDELKEEWEDYKPIELLIKDDKILKLVREWAEAFGVTKVYVCGIGDGKEYIELYAQDNGVTDGRIRISIPTQDGVWIGKEYAVDELCGEEKE